MCNITSDPSTPTETEAAKKVRRAAERARRKANKKCKKNETLVACSQNFNGGSSREKMEEISRQMQQQKIGIVFGQEGRRPNENHGRWDTGEVFIGFGGKQNKQSNKLKEGNFFVLNSEWKEAFMRGGKQTKMCSSRLASIRIPISSGRHLHLLNVHHPDSSKTVPVRRAFQLLLEKAFGDRGERDIMIAMGDWH
jgi:hypothetical protein